MHFHAAACMSLRSKKKCLRCFRLTFWPFRVTASSPFCASTNFLRVTRSNVST